MNASPIIEFTCQKLLMSRLILFIGCQYNLHQHFKRFHQELIIQLLGFFTVDFTCKPCRESVFCKDTYEVWETTVHRLAVLINKTFTGPVFEKAKT